MLSPPLGLDEGALRSALAAGWGLAALSVAYRALGFGSHHWEVKDANGGRWFLTVDELATKRRSQREPLSLTFDRHRAALTAALALAATGAGFVVAPVPTADGEPLVRVDEQFAAALYPYVEGRSFEWGEFTSREHRDAVLRLVVAVHAAPEPVRGLAITDDFAIAHRDALEAGLAGEVGSAGPYAARVQRLLTDHAALVRRLLVRYETLAATADLTRAVLTHGEPHPGNTMLTRDGWRLIDWDTTLVAPPERDLWLLGPVLDDYAEATGVAADPAMLELYRLRWGLADLAVDVRRFRAPHTGTPDDEKSWQILSSLLAGLDSAPR